MSIPTNRQEFAKFCLRRLGAPIIHIEVSEEQVDDLIDQALYHWQEYHYNGQELQYYMYKLTENDVQNKFITLPSNFIGVVNIFPIGQAISTSALFNMRYQFVLNDLYSLANVSIVPYYMVMSHLSLLEEMLVGQKPIRYNRHNNIVHLDIDMSDICAGIYIVIQAYAKIDPNQYPDAWTDKWLQDYTTNLIKRQWANMLMKYNPSSLPAGLRLDARGMYEDADRRIMEMETHIIRDSAGPAFCFIA